MIAWKLKLWRTVGAAAALGLAACGGEGSGPGEAGAGSGEAGEGSDAATTPAASGTAAPAAGGEAGEAGAVSAYAGLSGDQRTALRLNHLIGFVMAAEQVAEAGKPAEAGVLVSQGLLEVYDPASSEFGALDVAVVRAAADASALDRTRRLERLRAARAEIERAAGALEADHAVIVVRLVDIATGLYQGVVQEDFVDPIEYQHSMGAAYAAREALRDDPGDLRRRNQRAYGEAQRELDRLVELWPAPEAPERPTPYRQVLAQGSRVRLALSPFL